MYDFKCSSNLLDKLDMVQYDAARIVTGAWCGTPRDKLFNELGWESLKNRRIMRKLCLLHEIYYYNFPSYLDDIIAKVRPTSRRQLALPDEQTKLKIFPIGNLYFQKTFFPSTIMDWNRGDFSVTRSIECKDKFKETLLKIMRPAKKPWYGLMDHNYDHNRMRHITMLRMELSPLHAHKVKHKFLGVTPNCTICNVPEDTKHFLLTCTSFRLSRATMFRKVSEIKGIDISTLPLKRRTDILLYGSGNLSDDKNSNILKIVTDFTIATRRFDTT